MKTHSVSMKVYLGLPLVGGSTAQILILLHMIMTSPTKRCPVEAASPQHPRLHRGNHREVLNTVLGVVHLLFLPPYLPEQTNGT